MATIGQKIKTFRSLKNIDQDVICKEAGVSRSTISRIENDTLRPNGSVIAALAKLGMNIDELLPAAQGIEKEKVLHLRVSELELKLMQVESKLSDLIKFVEKKL